MQEFKQNLGGSILLSVLPLLLRSHQDPSAGAHALAPAQKFCVHRDLNYFPGSSSSAHKLDLYVPSDADEPVPVIVWIHGGSWTSGDKSECPASYYMPRGFAVASINYRLCQESIFPAQLYDCKQAIVWLRQHASDYNLADRIGVWGVSAGAHLSAMLGTTNHLPKFEPESLRDSGGAISSAVQAVCSWCGPSDLRTISQQMPVEQKLYWDQYPHLSPVWALLGGDLSEFSLSNASPISYVSKKAPPFLLVHGERDDVVPLAQSENFYKKLKASKVDASLFVASGEGHVMTHPDCIVKTLAFFHKWLA